MAYEIMPVISIVLIISRWI